MKNYPQIGVQIPAILLPDAHVDLTKWAVVACDQYTSQPEYWHQVAEIVGDAPSTYHLVLPEVYLGSEEEARRVKSTHVKMEQYLSKGVLQPLERMIYVERTVDGKTRRGIILALDLECYDFSAGSQSLIRATEGTIIDRLPPRVRIRKEAPLELPHILVLIDDPKDKVIGTVAKQHQKLPLAYDFDLMMNSGHLSGYIVDDNRLEKSVLANLESLADPERFYKKYGVSRDKGLLLFAVGDGNHSLATAKSIWESLKPTVGMDHPSRYALVEIENIHDHGLEFEPIHRVLFNVKIDIEADLQKHFGENLIFTSMPTSGELAEKVSQTSGKTQRFGLVTPRGYRLGEISNPQTNLVVGSLQPLLDKMVQSSAVGEIDYVHGADALFTLSTKPGNTGVFLPAMSKDELIRTVLREGALPRKTFSMGEAHEKRFYMEARKITA